MLPSSALFMVASFPFFYIFTNISSFKAWFIECILRFQEGVDEDISDFQMEQHASKNVNNCFHASIYSYIETSGGQSSNLYLNVAHFFNASVN